MTTKSVWNFVSACGLVAATFLAFASSALGGDAPASFSVKITGSGKPMILIPGLSCGGNVWDGAVGHFKDRYECHVLTLAGFAGQPAIAAPMLNRIRADVVKYIADKKLDHPVIIGHSLGGFMAYWVAITARDKVGPVVAVDGLPFLPAVFSPGATADSSAPFAEQYRATANAQSHDAFLAASHATLTSMITDPKDVDMVETASKLSNQKAVGQAFYELMTTDIRPAVKNIQAPLLLLGATSEIPDPAMRAAAEQVYQEEVSAIPHHKVVFVPHSRHFIMLDNPNFFYAQVDDFLKDAAAK